MQNERYAGLDGLRTAACIGIVLMHAQANMGLLLPGFVFQKLIPSFTDFVFLFMSISAFGLCCGYFEKLTCGGPFDYDSFYKKRYIKILPFFALLNLLEIVKNFSADGLHEVLANLSLTRAFYPNDISVIGVGWFLGLIFAFYMIFPFFCVLIRTKKRAWAALAAAFLLNYSCYAYFGVSRQNIIYSLCYFITGGLIYHYRERIRKLKAPVVIPIVILSLVLYYLNFVQEGNTINRLLVTAALMMLAITDCGSFLSNRYTRFVSGISMEIYLSHMMFFRIAQALGLDRINLPPILRILLVSAFMLIGSSAFALCFQRAERLLAGVWHKRRAHADPQS